MRIKSQAMIILLLRMIVKNVWGLIMIQPTDCPAVNSATIPARPFCKPPPSSWRSATLRSGPAAWRRLCESVGFETVAEIRAWLVEDHGTQLETHGNGKRQRTERKSFFRRLAERKGAPAIDY